jgi:hypothetical protein
MARSSSTSACRAAAARIADSPAPDALSPPLSRSYRGGVKPSQEWSCGSPKCGHLADVPALEAAYSSRRRCGCSFRSFPVNSAAALFLTSRAGSFIAQSHAQRGLRFASVLCRRVSYVQITPMYIRNVIPRGWAYLFWSTWPYRGAAMRTSPLRRSPKFTAYMEGSECPPVPSFLRWPLSARLTLSGHIEGAR